MATTNRAALIKKTIRVCRRHFEPHAPPKERTLLNNLLFGCLLENSPHAAAERAFSTLEKDYFDLNEVRVSTAKELAESFRGLADPLEAADRLKRTLHSVFESVYAFDIEPMKKQNIGQAVKAIDKYDGATPFTVAYVTQTSLGGHAIPINQGLLISLLAIGVISEGEAKKGVVPGLERAVPKSKGIEVGSLLHGLGVEVGRNPYGQPARKLLLEIEPTCKDRLPKRPAKQPEPEPEPKKPKKKPAAAPKTAEKSKSKPATKKASAKPKPTKKKAKAKAKKKAAKKKAKTKTKKKTASKRLSKKKPR